MVMEALTESAERVEFTYTDISPRTVAYGREAYSQQYRFMRFHVLDIEHDIAPQVCPLPRDSVAWLLLCHQHQQYPQALASVHSMMLLT